MQYYSTARKTTLQITLLTYSSLPTANIHVNECVATGEPSL
jgi:hypothetical protein